MEKKMVCSILYVQRILYQSVISLRNRRTFQNLTLKACKKKNKWSNMMDSFMIHFGDYKCHEN